MTLPSVPEPAPICEPAAAASGGLRLVAGAEDAGLRLDRFIALRLPGLSRSRVKALIEGGAVAGASGTLVDPATRVKPGQSMVVVVPPPEPAGPAGEAIGLAVVLEDEHLIVVHKPAGLVVHPAAGHRSGTLVNALIAHCGASLSGIGGVQRPGIVHRLDKDTSGLLVVAKTDAAHRHLAGQFASHGADGRLERGYLALAWGVPERRTGRVEAALARSRSNRTKVAVVRAGGRAAVTRYEVVETLAGRDGRPVVSLLRLSLETGRTHQIRVHMAHIGHPLLGDRLYGAGHAASARRLGPAARAAVERLGRQALHAFRLGFVHPAGGRKIVLESPLPADLEGLLAALRQQAKRARGG